MKKKKTTKKKAVKKVVKKTAKRKKGFTLIELLIVIAIIGILASVVLVSLSNARNKARVANFKSQVASLQSRAILECDGATTNALTSSMLGGDQTGYTIGTISGVSCGPAGTGAFDVVITSVGLTGGECSVHINETGANATNMAACQ